MNRGPGNNEEKRLKIDNKLLSFFLFFFALAPETMAPFDFSCVVLRCKG